MGRYVRQSSLSDITDQSKCLCIHLQWSLAPPACSKVENILTKIAAWEHRKYLWSCHFLDFSTQNTMRKIVRFSAPILFLTSPSHGLYIYIKCIHFECVDALQNWSNFLETRDTEMQTATGKTCFSEMIILFWYLRRLLCRRQILFSISSMLDGCEITETKEIGACEVLRAQELTHTHTDIWYMINIYIYTHTPTWYMHTGRERGYILPLERVYFDLEGTKASRSKWERWNLASAFFSLHFVGGLSIDKLRQSCRLLGSWC